MSIHSDSRIYAEKRQHSQYYSVSYEKETNFVSWLGTWDLLDSCSLDWFGGAGGRKFRSSLFNWTNCDRSVNDRLGLLLLLVFASSLVLLFFWTDELVDDDEDEREWLLCWTPGDNDVVDDDKEELVFDDDFRCKISDVCNVRGTGGCCSSLVAVWLFVSFNDDDNRVLSLAAASAAAAATKSDNCDGLSFSFKSKF